MTSMVLLAQQCVCESSAGLSDECRTGPSCCWLSSNWLGLWLHCTCRLISSLFSIGTVPYLLENRADPVLGSQPTGDSMHSHERVGGLPPPPTRPTATRMHSHKPGGRLPLHSTRPAVTFPVRPVPSYTAWWQRHIGVRNLPRVFTSWAQLRLKPTTSWLPRCHLISYYSAPKNRSSFYHLTEKTLLVSMELILSVSMLAWCCMCFCMCCSCELQSNCCPANGCVSLRCIYLQLLMWCMQTNSRQMFMCISPQQIMHANL